MCRISFRLIVLSLLAFGLASVCAVFPSSVSHAASPQFVNIKDPNTVPWVKVSTKKVPMPEALCQKLLQLKPQLARNPAAYIETETFKESVLLYQTPDGRYYVANPVTPQINTCCCHVAGTVGYYQDHYDAFWPYDAAHTAYFNYPGNCAVPTVTYDTCSPTSYHWPVTSLNVSCSHFINGDFSEAYQNISFTIWLAGGQSCSQHIEVDGGPDVGLYDNC